MKFRSKKRLKDWFSEFETNWFHFSISLQWKFWPSEIHSTNEKTALAMLRALMLIEMFAEIWNSQILVRVLKSDNLQYNTLVHWVAGMNDSLTKRLMFQVLYFFMISCRILCKNTFNLFIYFLKKYKNKSKEFWVP